MGVWVFQRPPPAQPSRGRAEGSTVLVLGVPCQHKVLTELGCTAHPTGWRCHKPEILLKALAKGREGGSLFKRNPGQLHCEVCAVELNHHPQHPPLRWIHPPQPGCRQWQRGFYPKSPTPAPHYKCTSWGAEGKCLKNCKCLWSRFPSDPVKDSGSALQLLLTSEPSAKRD